MEGGDGPVGSHLQDGGMGSVQGHTRPLVWWVWGSAFKSVVIVPGARGQPVSVVGLWVGAQGVGMCCNLNEGCTFGGMEEGFHCH